MPSPVSVAFLNENALGHGSYLPRFARALSGRPDLGILPHLLDVLPLPPADQRRADRSIRGLRKVGLDFQASRWRNVTSTHARTLLEQLRHGPASRIEAVVVNTQSVGLDLADLGPDLPVFVCLDATFAQLARSPWFAPNRVAAWLQPLTLARLRARERRLFAAARRFLVWSAPVRDSLVADYGIPSDRIDVLPPSLDLQLFGPGATAPPSSSLPRLLFVGGDFVRKGGPVLLEVFRSRFRGRAELHVVTQTAAEPEPGVFIHRNVTAGSDRWLELWRSAGGFVFPSRLETFGIVLLEALAFGVPVVSSRAGAAADILENGRLGILLPEVSGDALGGAIEALLSDRDAALARAREGRLRVERDFDLPTNAGRLAGWILDATRSRGSR